MKEYISSRAVRYSIIAAHGLMVSLRSYVPNADAKLQAAADRAADMLHDFINDLHDYEEARIDQETDRESGACSEAKA